MTHLNKHQMALLPALYALLSEKNVSKAATRMNLTQPAMSKILTQLRTQFNDELLVRCAKQYQLTTRAEQVLGELHHLMPQIQSVWKPSILDLNTVDKKVSLAGTDMDIMVASKALMSIVNGAKHLQLSISSSHEYSMEDLLQGKIDFLFSAFDSEHSGLYRKLWLQSDYVMVSHKDNSRVKNAMVLQDYLDLPHIAFQLSNSNQTAVDIALKSLGHQRKTSVWVPTFIQAAAFIKAQESDLVLTMPRVFVEYLDDDQSLRVSKLPFDINPLKIYFYWHKKGHNDLLNQWIRETILG